MKYLQVPSRRIAAWPISLYTQNISLNGIFFILKESPHLLVSHFGQASWNSAVVGRECVLWLREKR